MLVLDEAHKLRNLYGVDKPPQVAKRFRKALETADVLRLDHFRGFESYWEIPAGERTARNGRWVKSPGKELFETLRARFPEAEITRESRNDGAAFDVDLRAALHAGADRRGVPAGDLPSYAGHDAGILAPHVPPAMLFVRNPTGASHTPAESASDDDCVAAAQVLADALEARLTAA